MSYENELSLLYRHFWQEVEMSYVGYIPFFKQFLSTTLPAAHVPAVLEVGVDRGTTFLPLCVHLLRTRPQFMLVGLDIMIQEQLLLTLRNFDATEEQQVYAIQENSLSILPKMIESGTKFDIVLLDGDHNYHTVSQELQYIEALTLPHSIVMVDDYDGRWSDRDLWYAERPGYEDVKIATAPVQSDKHGVKAAVDDWLAMNAEWELHKLLPGEPVVLTRKGIFTFNATQQTSKITAQNDVSVDEWLQAPPETDKTA